MTTSTKYNPRQISEWVMIIDHLKQKDLYKDKQVEMFAKIKDNISMMSKNEAASLVEYYRTIGDPSETSTELVKFVSFLVLTWVNR